tara:strand:+ start:3198 stop:5384 length:2187 start_codon:yes stop_codon:yes gene_type:complete
MAKKKKSDDNKLWLDWCQELKGLQESDLDQREQARESDRFLLDKDGQWEDHVAQSLDSQNRPRYTFDKVTPVIEAMMADIEDMDFGGNVKPSGGTANKETALTYDGMIRSIQNQSNTEHQYRQIARRVIRRGFDAVVIKAKYADEWSFEQDLFVESIPNAVNRVWVSNTSTDPASADSDVAYVLTSMEPDAYKKQWPEGSGISVDDGSLDDNWDDYEPEVVTIGERYYPEEKMVEVAQLNNGDVVELNDDWAKIKDEKAAQNIFIAKDSDGKEKIKKVKGFTWYHCVFDGGGILEEGRKTVFKTNPIVTFYGNHEILGQNSKITYSGITLKQMDSQRVHNYAKSREIEEGALSPRGKYWMTKAQAKGHTTQLSKMNTSADPVQFFNPDPEIPGYPQYVAGAQINPHLATLGNQMGMDIKEQASVFDPMQGQFAGRQSEDAIRMQIDRGTASTRKWVNSLVYGIQRICNILVETIPVVYDTKRQFSIIGIDGTESMVQLNEEVFDQQSNQMIKFNDLNAGKYKVTVDAGPAFSNKLEAGLAALTEYAALDPSIIQTGGDIMLKAIDAPMVDQIAERKRIQMLQAGMIPAEQMTEEETAQQQQMAESQQNQPPSPEQMIGEAEMMKAQTEQQSAQFDQQERVAQHELAMQKLGLEARKVEQQGMKIQADYQSKQDTDLDRAQKISDIEYKNAQTLKTMADAEKVAGETDDQRMERLIHSMPTDNLIGLLQ